MRACPGCGDWVGDANASCPRCGRDLSAPPPASVPSAPSAPAWPAAPPSRPSGAAGPGPGAPAPPVPEWAPQVPPGWDRYAGGYAQPRRKRRIWPRVLGITFGIIAGFIVVGVVLTLVFGNRPPPALNGYMDGKGTVYTTADRQMRVRLSEPPDVTTQAIPVSGLQLRAQIAIVAKKTYELGVYEVHGLPPNAGTQDIRASLDGSMTGAAVAADLTMKGSEHTTFRGYEALRGSAKDNKGAEVEVLFFFTPRGEYGLLAHTRRGAGKVLAEMEKSVEMFAANS